MGALSQDYGMATCYLTSLFTLLVNGSCAKCHIVIIHERCCLCMCTCSSWELLFTCSSMLCSHDCSCGNKM